MFGNRNTRWIAIRSHQFAFALGPEIFEHLDGFAAESPDLAHIPRIPRRPQMSDSEFRSACPQKDSYCSWSHWKARLHELLPCPRSIVLRFRPNGLSDSTTPAVHRPGYYPSVQCVLAMRRKSARAASRAPVRVRFDGDRLRRSSRVPKPGLRYGNGPRISRLCIQAELPASLGAHIARKQRTNACLGKKRVLLIGADRGSR